MPKVRGSPGGAAAGGAQPGADSAAHVAALERQVEECRLLLETSAAISGSAALDETLALIVRLVVERLAAGWCDVFDHSAAHGAFSVVASYQLPELGGDAPDRPGSLCDTAARPRLEWSSRERSPSIRYRDDPGLTEAECADMDKRGELSGISLPLVYRDEVVGLLEVGESRQPRRWSDDDVQVLRAVADQTAVAMAAARACARLSEEATSDGLTGLFDQRHCHEHLRQEVATARRYGEDLSLAIVDVDGFQAFKGAHGSAAGDKLLLEIAAILRAGTRQEVDILARYGGDEFVLILPQTRTTGAEPTAARNVSERIRGAVAAHAFEGSSGRRHVSVTVSVGVAGVGIGGYTPEELLSSADKALYLSKRLGKDRVSVFGT